MTPTDIKKKADNQLAITWDDGHESLFAMDMLRKKCPCATCKEVKESSGSTGALNILSPEAVLQPDVQIREAEIVGRYAVQFSFSDGHREGIYSFDYLLQLCQCHQCQSS